MNLITRYVDHPFLDGAAAILRFWHIHTGQRPERLEPVWNIAVLSVLLVASGHFLYGRALTLGIAVIVMLALPSIWRLVSATRKGAQTYDAREYKSLRARAAFNRQAQWAIRLIVLFAAACIPFLPQSGDPLGAAFMLGASLWFVLTAPARFYLDAAEPPAPDNGDRAVRGNLQFN